MLQDMADMIANERVRVTGPESIGLQAHLAAAASYCQPSCAAAMQVRRLKPLNNALTPVFDDCKRTTTQRLQLKVN